jgi:hypothetical protein
MQISFIRRFRRFTQIFGGMSCRCAPSHAAGFFVDWGRLPQIAFFSCAGAEVFYPQIAQIIADFWRHDLSLRGNSRRWFFRGLGQIAAD